MSPSCPFVLDFVLVYEEIEGEETPKETLRYRKKYMNNLQKSQLEFEEVRESVVCLFVFFLLLLLLLFFLFLFMF